MALRLSNQLRTDMVTAIQTALTGGDVQIYTGAQPAGPDTVASGTLLGTIPLGSPVFSSITDGEGLLTVPIEVVATNAGTAGYARFRTSGGLARIDASITEAGGGGDLIIDTATVAVDDTLRIISYTLTMPAE